MRIVMISDTHGRHREVKVPDGDLLIHAGDICMSHTRDRQKRNRVELEDFNDWIGGQPHSKKIVIAGNHDFPFVEYPRLAQAILSNATYLQDSGDDFQGFNIWGSPWQPWNGGWAFNEARGPSLASRWSKIPDETDILVTHSPPMGVKDATMHGNAGSQTLTKRVREVRPIVHVFGHIHEGRGKVERGGTLFFNACVVDTRYRVVWDPYVVDI